MGRVLGLGGPGGPEDTLDDGKTPALMGASQKGPGQFSFNGCKFGNKTMFPSRLEEGQVGMKMKCGEPEGLNLGCRRSRAEG